MVCDAGGCSHVRRQDDVGSFGGGDDVREKGVGARLDCLLQRGDDICCV